MYIINFCVQYIFENRRQMLRL